MFILHVQREGGVRVCGTEGEDGGEQRLEGLEVVDDPADGLDVGILRLPLVMAAVVSSFHNVHATTEVRLFIHHPPKEKCANLAIIL